MIKDQEVVEVVRCSRLDPQVIPRTYRRLQEVRAQLDRKIQQQEVLALIPIRL